MIGRARELVRDARRTLTAVRSLPEHLDAMYAWHQETERRLGIIRGRLDGLHDRCEDLDARVAEFETSPQRMRRGLL